MKTKKIVALLCAAATMTAVSASAEWQFAGYDTVIPGNYNKLYNEVINGRYTSKMKSEPVAEEDIEWKFEGYEAQYPHAGYERLYLEGNAQKRITRLTNLFPQWETRFKDFMWEVCGEHRIYQRQQTKINNSYWAWDFGRTAYEDSCVFVPTTRCAETVDSFRPYGIANLDLDGNYVFDVNGIVYDEDKYIAYQTFAMPTPFNVDPKDGKEIVAGDFFHADNLSRTGDDGKYIVTDWEIAQNIDLMQSKFVTGPSYYGENGTKDVEAMFTANRNEGWFWDYDTVKATTDAEIAWTAPLYEMQEPYNYYQYLIVNGLVMDGRADTPRIFRYTGGKATPDVTWKYAFVESDYPYNIVEYKCIRDNTGKMVQAADLDGNPIYRYPTGEYGNRYFVVTDTQVQLWVRDNVKDYMIDAINRTDADFGSWYEGHTSGAVGVYY